MPRQVFQSFRIGQIPLGCWAVVAVLACLTTPSVAAADEPPATLERFQLSVGARYGFDMESAAFDPWTAGAGIAAGYTLSQSIYVGGSFDYFQGERYYYLGDAFVYQNGVRRESPEVGGNYYQMLAQLGYDMALSRRWVLRPKVGVGAATLDVDECLTDVGNDINCTHTIKTDTTIAPAVELIFVSPITLSAEVRMVMLFDSVTVKTAAIGGLSIGF